MTLLPQEVLDCLQEAKAAIQAAEEAMAKTLEDQQEKFEQLQSKLALVEKECDDARKLADKQMMHLETEAKEKVDRLTAKLADSQRKSQPLPKEPLPIVDKAERLPKSVEKEEEQHLALAIIDNKEDKNLPIAENEEEREAKARKTSGARKDRRKDEASRTGSCSAAEEGEGPYSDYETCSEKSGAEGERGSKEQRKSSPEGRQGALQSVSRGDSRDGDRCADDKASSHRGRHTRHHGRRRKHHTHHRKHRSGGRVDGSWSPQDRGRHRSRSQRRNSSRLGSHGRERSDSRYRSRSGGRGGKGRGKGGKGDREIPLCIGFVTSKCTFGSKCRDRHPATSEDCRMARETLTSKDCRFGATCKRKDCVFKHPEGGKEFPWKEDRRR